MNNSCKSYWAIVSHWINKGKFLIKRNCGAALVEEYNKIMYYYQLSWLRELAKEFQSWHSEHNPFLRANDSIWWRANAWNVSFETLYGGQLMLSSQLIILLKNYPIVSHWYFLLSSSRVAALKCISGGDQASENSHGRKRVMWSIWVLKSWYLVNHIL